jgi:hypothetical protein
MSQVRKLPLKPPVEWKNDNALATTMAAAQVHDRRDVMSQAEGYV